MRKLLDNLYWSVFDRFWAAESDSKTEAFWAWVMDRVKGLADWYEAL